MDKSKTIEELQKKTEMDLVNRLEREFPNMIEKKQAIFIEPIVKHMPNVLKILESRWELEYIYDEETGTVIWFLKPLRRKSDEY